MSFGLCVFFPLHRSPKWSDTREDAQRFVERGKTTEQITTHSKTGLTSAPTGQRRHAVGDKWSTGPYCPQAPRLFIDFLNDPLWSDLGGRRPRQRASSNVGRHVLRRFLWFIRGWTDAGPGPASCLLRANSRVRKQVWIQDATSSVKNKSREGEQALSYIRKGIGDFIKLFQGKHYQRKLSET